MREHGGGSDGIRDGGLLDSALGRPRNLAAYSDDVDAFALAAAYAYGIARNHPFIDGNKRTAFVVAAFFLDLQGIDLVREQRDVIETVLALAAGDLTEDDFAEWLRGATAPNDRDRREDGR